MTAFTPIPRSVRDAVLDLANAAEVLAETAAEAATWRHDLPRWFTFPTTPQERVRAKRSQERRVVWLDATADAMRARWAKQQDAYYAAKDAANG